MAELNRLTKIDRLPKSIAALICVVAFGGLELLVKFLPHLDAGPGAIILREVVLLLFAVGLCWALIRVLEIPARELGLVTPRLSTLGWGLVAGIAMILISVAAIAVFYQFGVQLGGRTLAGLAAQPLALIMLISLTAAISEELIFRSVLITHLGSFLTSTTAGALGSLLLFALAHLSGWGAAQVVFAAIAGSVPTVVFWWKRDVGICIIAHFVTDMAGILAAFAQAHAHP